MSPDQGHQRVLVSMKGYLGDAVMATPLLRALRKAEIQVFVGAPPIVGELLATPDFVDFTRARGLAGLRHQVRSFRQIRPDVAILINRSFRSALAAWLARVPVRVGHATEGRGALLTKSLPYGPVTPETESYFELGELAFPQLARDLIPRLELTNAEIAGAQRRLADLRGPVFALQPGARYVDKQLRTHHLVPVVEALQASGYTPVLLGGSDEREATENLLQATNVRGPNLVGELTIRETMAVLSQVALTIGADTGLMHVSVAVGTPTLVVFGPNPAEKWGHTFGKNRVLKSEGGDMDRVDVKALVQAAQEMAASLSHPKAASMR
jgi:ADP-heptose:LPS heptosyltransferase